MNATAISTARPTNRGATTCVAQARAARPSAMPETLLPAVTAGAGAAAGVLGTVDGREAWVKSTGGRRAWAGGGASKQA